MSRALRWLLFAALVLALAAAGAGLLAARGEGDPLAQARTRLQAGDNQGAARLAREALARDPARGRAFGVLARALAGEGSAADVLARYQVAARRAPRDVHVRGWLALHHLKAGEYAPAMAHLDALLTVSPGNRETLLPMIVQLAQSPEFADALAEHMARKPRWRAVVLRSLVAKDAPAAAADNVFGALNRRGALSREEFDRWLEGMLTGGRWGAAYAHWVGSLGDAPGRLPLLYNGDFAKSPSGGGFDWRLRRVRGVVPGWIPLSAGSHGIRLSFLGRAVDRPGLDHPLLLAPGRYRLSVRASAGNLRSERGLAWNLACSDNRTRIARGAELRDGQGWESATLDFDVPASGCEGQWLRLVNPAPRGLAQVLRGDVRIAEVRLEALEE